VAPAFLDDANYVESIAAGTFTDTAAEALNQLIVDDRIDPPGHRIHLLAMAPFFEDHREIGVGHTFNLSSYYRNYWAVHTVYSSTSDRFLTGVIFDDANGNGRYDLNEELPGVTVSVNGGPSTTTNAAGGWSIKVAGGGVWAVTASGGGFVGTATADVTVGTANVEVDFLSGQDSAYIDFEPVGPPPNHAPVLRTTGTVALPAIAEDAAAPAGQVLSALVGPFITDADPGDLRGVAITGTAGAGA
jgi:hypothetical protein